MYIFIARHYSLNNNCSHIIYNVLEIISHLDMILSSWEQEYRLFANTIICQCYSTILASTEFWNQPSLLSPPSLRLRIAILT